MKRTPRTFIFTNKYPENIWDIKRTIHPAIKRKKYLQVIFPLTKMGIVKYNGLFYIIGVKNG